MSQVTRREFLKIGSRLAVLFGLSSSAVSALAETLENISRGLAPVLWLQGQSCSGCSVSLLNSEPLTPGRLLTQYLSLQFHQTLSGATGHQAVKLVNATIAKGGYILVVEGSVPAGMPKACTFGEEPFVDQLQRAAGAASAVLAVGACSAWGGIPAAEGNPTGSISVPAFLAQKRIKKPTIRIPGCPPHPDWIVGTIAHQLRFGLPPLDELGRPRAFFSKTIHDQCPRFADYERENFATKFGDDGCLFKLGCAGPVTKADCTLRGWNGNVNNCITAQAPCVGCASEGFALHRDIPFYRKSEGARA